MISTERQLREARQLVGWNRSELAKRAQIGMDTIRRMESFGGLIGMRLATLQKVENVLAAAGVVFTQDGVQTTAEFSPLTQSLSDRDKEILAMVADGYTIREIAQKLGVSPKTADYHRTRLYRRLGVAGAVGATRWAIRNGYLTA